MKGIICLIAYYLATRGTYHNALMLSQEGCQAAEISFDSTVVCRSCRAGIRMKVAYEDEH